MEMGDANLSLYDWLYLPRYYHNRSQFNELNLDQFVVSSIDFYFPSEQYLIWVNPHKTMSLKKLCKRIDVDLKSHRVKIAEEKKWHAYLFKRAVDNNYLYE